MEVAAERQQEGELPLNDGITLSNSEVEIIESCGNVKGREKKIEKVEQAAGKVDIVESRSEVKGRGKKRKQEIVESRREVKGRKVKAADNAHLGGADRVIGKQEKDNREAGGGKTGDNDLVHVSVLIKGTTRKKEQRIASVKDLFTESRSTITLVDEGITYSCGPPRQTRCNQKTVQYYKVYKCCMVHIKKIKSGRMIQSTETYRIVMSSVVRGGSGLLSKAHILVYNETLSHV